MWRTVIREAPGRAGRLLVALGGLRPHSGRGGSHSGVGAEEGGEPTCAFRDPPVRWEQEQKRWRSSHGKNTGESHGEVRGWIWNPQGSLLWEEYGGTGRGPLKEKESYEPSPRETCMCVCTSTRTDRLAHIHVHVHTLTHSCASTHEHALSHTRTNTMLRGTLEDSRTP